MRHWNGSAFVRCLSNHVALPPSSQWTDNISPNVNVKQKPPSLSFFLSFCPSFILRSTLVVWKWTRDDSKKTRRNNRKVERGKKRLWLHQATWRFRLVAWTPFRSERSSFYFFFFERWTSAVSLHQLFLEPFCRFCSYTATRWNDRLNIDVFRLEKITTQKSSRQEMGRKNKRGKRKELLGKRRIFSLWFFFGDFSKRNVRFKDDRPKTLTTKTFASVWRVSFESKYMGGCQST